RKRKADGGNLVGTHRAVTIRAIDHVVQTFGLVVPELLAEAVASLVGHVPVPRLGFLVPESTRELLHGAHSVVPERLRFYGLSDPRGHYPVTDLGVHPGELHAGLSRKQEPVFIDANDV